MHVSMPLPAIPAILLLLAQPTRGLAPQARRTPHAGYHGQGQTDFFVLLRRPLFSSRCSRWHRVPRPRRVNGATTRSWAHDRLADVAVDDINYTTRSNVNVGQIRAKAAAKIGA